MSNQNNSPGGFLSNLPRKLIRVIQFLYGIDIQDSLALFKQLVYLYREYYILTDIKPIIKEYIVTFKYKEEVLVHARVKSLKEILDIVNSIKLARSCNYD